MTTSVADSLNRRVTFGEKKEEERETVSLFLVPHNVAASFLRDIHEGVQKLDFVNCQQSGAASSDATFAVICPDIPNFTILFIFGTCNFL